MDINNNLDKEFIEIGKKSFARFFSLTEEEANEIMNNPNNVFYEMILDIKMSLNNYENFMVKVKKEERGELKISRFDIIDL